VMIIHRQQQAVKVELFFFGEKRPLLNSGNDLFQRGFDLASSAF
jgi:hypothetical protein